MLLLLLLAYLNLSVVVEASYIQRVPRQAGPTCITPNNERGTCIDLKSCTLLYHMVKTSGRDAATASFLRKSQCGYHNGSPMVCCAQDTGFTSATDDAVIFRTTPSTGGTRRPPPAVLRPSVNPSNAWAECGKSEKKDLRIVGGKNASLGEWPWMVALGYRTNNRPGLDFKCGATLISDKWVISAAHCVTNLGAWELSVARLGDLDLNPIAQDNASEIDIEIDEVFVHPDYSTSPIINDIALLRLKHAVRFSKYIRPICLLAGKAYKSDTYYSRKRPFIIGWGAIEWRGLTSTRLQETSIRIVDPETCTQAYFQQRSARIDGKVLCAGEPGKDTCQGDSGGPLIFPEDVTTNLTFYLGGIVSYGIQCANPNFPGVYTRVAAFAGWIAQTTGIPV